MPNHTQRLARRTFFLCFASGILIGGAYTLARRSPMPMPAPEPATAPEFVVQTPPPDIEPRLPKRNQNALNECKALLNQADTDSVDKTRLIAIIQELAIAKQDLISPLLDQLLEVLGADSAFRMPAYNWAVEHPAAAMQFCLDFEGSPDKIKNIKSSAGRMPGGARLFIDHLASATNLKGVAESDVKIALWALKHSGADIIAEIKSLPTELRDNQYSYELSSMSETDPAAAFQLAFSDPEIAAASKRAAFEILEGLFIQDPKMADTFLDRLPDAFKKDYAFHAVPALVGAGMTDRALQLASQLLSPEGVEQFEADPTELFQHLTNHYVSSGRGTADLVDWLQKLPTPELRASGETEFMKIIIKEDPVSTIPWLQSSEPGDTRDAYLAQLLGDLPTDHDNYGQMLDLIENPDVRTAAEEAAASRPRFDLPSDEK